MTEFWLVMAKQQIRIGGHLDNLQLLCGHCNSKRGTRSQGWLIAQLKMEGLR